MTADDLKAYVSAPESDAEFVGACWTEAEELILDFVGAAIVPDSVIARATLEVGSELFHRRQAPSGFSQFATPDGSAARVARDPMVGAYPLLGRYLGLGFA